MGNNMDLNYEMFCYQCEQTAGGKGCTKLGVCGKTPEVAGLQDLLIYQLKGISCCQKVLMDRGEKPAEDVTGDVATIAPGVSFGDRAVIGPKAMVYNDVEEGQEQC